LGRWIRGSLPGVKRGIEALQQSGEGFLTAAPRLGKTGRQRPCQPFIWPCECDANCLKVRAQAGD